MSMTMAQAQIARRDAIAQNRNLGVVEYRSGEKQSDVVYEVTEGIKHLPGGKRLGPGMRFRPTVKQVQSGALRGKAEEISATEMRALASAPSVGAFAGADFEAMRLDGLKSIAMTDDALAFAIESKLERSDFGQFAPEGQGGKYTKAQVRRIVDEQQKAVS